MEYTNDTHIETIEQVKEFMRYLTSERELSILPEENENLTVKELNLFDRLTEEALAVCEKEGVDLYELVQQEMKK